jgi:hypothetical protein
MKRTTALYVVQRQAPDAQEWSRVACCNSLAFAQLIAVAGMRQRIGVKYRAIHSRSGAKVTLGRAQHEKAA